MNDDDASDDDDPTDDDDLTDDDDVVVDEREMLLTVELTATLKSPLDNGQVVGSTGLATYSLFYEDLVGGGPICRSVLEVAFEVVPEAPDPSTDCPSCSGVLLADPGSLSETSGLFDDGCPPEEPYFAELASELLGGSDRTLLDVGLIPASLHEESGVALHVGGGYSLEEVRALRPEAEYLFVGAVEMVDDAPNVLSGLGLLAHALDEDSSWLPMWAFFGTEDFEVLTGVGLWHFAVY